MNTNDLSSYFQAGTVTVACTANTISTQSVTFPKAFSSTPTVVVTANSTVPGTILQEVCVTDLSTTGFTICAYRTNDTNMGVLWMAMKRS